VVFLTNFGTLGSAVAGALSVGSHYDPYDTKAHGCPDSSGVNMGNHAGDLGNWQATGGTINGRKTFSNIRIDDSINSVMGRTVVLHAKEDDCLDINSSGNRLGLGVIGIRFVNVTETTNHAKANLNAGLMEAVCVFDGTTDCKGTNCDINNSGFVYFYQKGNTISIKAQVFGIDTERGFHIHNFGDISSPTGDNTGGHWNPLNTKHGLPGQEELHFGDLGSIKTFSRHPKFGIYFHSLSYDYPEWTIDNIIGRGVIVHEGIDHGNEPSCPGSDKNGSAGKRIYQCVIGIMNTADQNEENNLLPYIDTGYFTFNNTWKNTPCGNGSLNHCKEMKKN